MFTILDSARRFVRTIRFGFVLVFCCSCNKSANEQYSSDIEEITVLTLAVDNFKNAQGRLPTEAEGLGVVFDLFPGVYGWNGRLYSRKHLPRDSWGRALQYRRCSECERGFIIYSMGYDGVSKTKGFDRDDLNPMCKSEQK